MIGSMPVVRRTQYVEPHRADDGMLASPPQVTRKENTMISNASRAFPAWAMPALVSLLLAAPVAGHASEGNAAPPSTPSTAAIAAPILIAPALPALTLIAQATGTPAPANPLATPAPRAIAAGPVWTDASGVWRQAGIASWYGGKRWQGKMTASGVRYDERQLTAAHASLPIGSRVRVTVADTGHSVVVTINDRPGTRRRIIDLSRAAAAELGIVARGVTQVTLSPA